MTELVLYAVDWFADDVEPEDDESESEDGGRRKPRVCPNVFNIKAFCRDQQGRSAMVNINGFKPYFYIRVPDTWDSQTVDGLFIPGIKTAAKPWYAGTLLSWQLVNAKSLYGFTADDRFLFLKLTFSCMKGFNGFRYLFNEPVRIPGVKQEMFEQYESNIPALLRFLHTKRLNATGWMKITGYIESRDSESESTCGREFTIDLTGKGRINPYESDDMPAIKCMAFDIEADSSHGDFPIAKKDYQKLAQDMVTEYMVVRKDLKDRSQMPNVIATFLKYAFDPWYSNENIIHIGPSTDLSGLTPEHILGLEPHVGMAANKALVETMAPGILAALNADCSEEIATILTETLEKECGGQTEQIIKSWNRHVATNNAGLKSPIDVVRNMLTLMLDPYYKNYNINRVYYRGARPDAKLLLRLIPKIQALCDTAADARALEQKYAGSTSKAIPKGFAADNKKKVADSIATLTQLLNRSLPAVLGDSVIQIGSTFKLPGDTDCYLKHIICLNTCDAITNATLIDHEHTGIELPEKELKAISKELGCPADQVSEQLRQRQHTTDRAQVVVETYDTEEEVLLAWQRLIVAQDPDIIIGYNIFGFDFRYLYDRADKLGILHQFAHIGRIREKKEELVEQKLSSAALGDNLLYYISTTGRISIDLYNAVQKIASLASYKLDDVSRTFLYKTKVDITPEEIFIKQKGDSHDRMIIAEYCLMDCILCNRLMDKLEILSNNIGMSQVCCVPLSYLFLRGQGIKLLSYVAKECRKAGLVIPVIKNAEGDEEEGYEGAIVLEPKTGIHYEPVGVLDFNSLYPSCMISENLSHEMFIGSTQVLKGESTDFRGRCLTSSAYEKQLVEDSEPQSLPGWDYVDIVYDIYTEVPVAGRKTTVKQVTGHNICRFAQPPDSGKGIIPRILMDLLASRKTAKNRRDDFPKGSFRYNIYEGLQLAYKVTANSLYGIIGASTSKIRLKEIAACTTAVGRKLIMFTSAYITRNYPGSSVVYGDTDSVFIKFDPRDRFGEKLSGVDAVYKTMEYCMESAMCVSRLLKRPHNLEFEKVIFPFVLVSKKRYHGHYYTEWGNPKYSVKSMGIVLKRRDNADIVKHIFGGMMDIIMKDHSTDKAIRFVQEECKKVLAGEFPIDQFIITKTLRGYYASPDSIAHNVLAQRIGRRDPGNRPRANDRIPFAYIQAPANVKLQGDRIETPVFIQKNGLKLNYTHYITNQIAKPVSQIFELAGKGADVFERLLTDYEHEKQGIRKITDFFKVHDRKLPIQFNDESSDESDEE